MGTVSAGSGVSATDSSSSTPTFNRQVLYYILSPKAGDGLSNPFTETAFASQATIPAALLVPGNKFWITIRGTYNIPTGTLNPTATARLKFGGVTIFDTGALSAGVGTGSLPFFGKAEILITAANQCNGNADFSFQVTSGATPTASTLGISKGVTTITTSSSQAITATVIATPNTATGTSFTMTDLIVEYSVAPPGAN